MYWVVFQQCWSRTIFLGSSTLVRWTFDRKRISTNSNPNLNPNSHTNPNPNPKSNA